MIHSVMVCIYFSQILMLKADKAGWLTNAKCSSQVAKVALFAEWIEFSITISHTLLFSFVITELDRTGLADHGAFPRPSGKSGQVLSMGTQFWLLRNCLFRLYSFSITSAGIKRDLLLTSIFYGLLTRCSTGSHEQDHRKPQKTLVHIVLKGNLHFFTPQRGSCSTASRFKWRRSNWKNNYLCMGLCRYLMDYHSRGEKLKRPFKIFAPFWDMQLQ